MVNFTEDENIKGTRSMALFDGPGFTKREELWQPRN